MDHAQTPPAKLQPPVYLTRLLARAVLAERLDSTLSVQLALIRTPAGYGKTTLLAQWWNGLPAETVARGWLSLDEEEREPTQFVAGVADALAQAGAIKNLTGIDIRRGRFGIAADAALQSLIGEILTSERPTVLVLDDYHHVESAEIDRLLAQLLRKRPANLHLAVATRTRPGFPLSSLRLAGQVLELTEKDLRFNDSELGELLDCCLSDDELVRLNQKMEGWPAAAQLARLWLEDGGTPQDLLHGFHGNVDEIATYMTEQVFARLPANIRDFLIDTAVLEHIHAGLADAVRDADDSRRILDQLDRLNALFFPIGRAREWYRHHQLFAEFLKAQLAGHCAGRIADLHRRASAWFEANGHLADAVQHACKAGDTAHAVRLAERAGGIRYALEVGLPAFKRLLQDLPQQALFKSPRLLAAQALALMKDGRPADGYAIVVSVRERMEAGQFELDGEERADAERDILVADALSVSYQDNMAPPSMVAKMEALTGTISPEGVWFRGFLNNILCVQHFRLGNMTSAQAAVQTGLNCYRDAGTVYGVIFMYVHGALFALTRGNVHEAESGLTRAGELCERHMAGDSLLRAVIDVVKAAVCYELGDLEAAGELSFESLPVIESNEGWFELYACGYHTASELAFRRSGLAAAETVLDRAIQVARDRGLPRLAAAVLAQRLHLMARAGKISEAKTFVAESEFSLDGGHVSATEVGWREREDAEFVLARLALLTERPQEALDLLEAVEARAREFERGRRLLVALILQAQCFRALGKADLMAERTKQALMLSRAEALEQCFLEEGGRGADLLKAVLAHVGVSGMTRSTLDWVAKILSDIEGNAMPQQRSLTGALFTDRERQILNEMKDGGSNKMIARRLDVSDHAVKFHLKNIYRKLGVNGRRLALSVARSRGLIEGEVPAAE